jgi:metal-responsive CopG/Arc/MetJ family transcriptional regulator
MFNNHSGKWTYLYRQEYLSGMENVAVHLPRQLVEQVDEAARDEMRSRSNLVRLLVAEGLQRRSQDASNTQPAEASR